jgi:hypothetical protein
VSTPGGLPEITSVSGGAGGVEARHQDLEQLAQFYDKTGEQVQADAWEDKGLLVDGDLVASAVLSPVSFAEAEAAVIAATVGPGGLASRAIGFEVDTFAIRACIKAYQIADDIAHAAGEALDYALGFGVGLALPGIVVGGAALLTIGGAGLIATNPGLAALIATNPDLQEKIKDLGGDLGGAALNEVQEWLESHPDAVQHLLNGGGGLLDGLSTGLVPPPLRGPVLDLLGIDPLNPTVNDAAGGLAGLFTDTEPVVTRGGVDIDPTEPGVQNRALPGPSNVADLVDGITQTYGEADGEINIQTVGGPGNERYIVTLPGTDSWGDDPNDVRDLQANLQLAGGDDTAYNRGIKEAMKQAGIPEGAPVMLVGHSQGGMTAAHLAADAEFSSKYDVKQVVTVGAPTAQVPDIPAHTQVLSIENTGDMVPLTDGEDNPDSPNRTTVQFDGRTGSLGHNHGMDTYTKGAEAVDASDDPSINAAINKMHEDGFLGPSERRPTQTQTFTITRNR